MSYAAAVRRTPATPRDVHYEKTGWHRLPDACRMHFWAGPSSLTMRWSPVSSPTAPPVQSSASAVGPWASMTRPSTTLFASTALTFYAGRPAASHVSEGICQSGILRQVFQSFRNTVSFSFAHLESPFPSAFPLSLDVGETQPYRTNMVLH